MKTFRSSNDLEQFGIVALTGEACAAGYRCLYDLTQKGLEIVLDFLGLPVDTQLHSNWNNGSPDDPHVASIMLAPELVRPLAIWAFGMDGADAIIIHKEGADGYYFRRGDTQADFEEHLDFYRSCRCLDRTFLGSQIRKGREMHQMSGRTC